MFRACVVAAVLAVSAHSAEAYEFWLRAQTIGQGYELRSYRLVGPDLFLGRREFTQTLALRIIDIGDFSADRRRSRLPDHGLRISWQSYIRLDHDFGDYTNGTINTGKMGVQDAIDAIPELTDSVVKLDLMYGYLSFDGIADDHINVQLGRILGDDGWGTMAYDGAATRFELPAPIAVTASAGLRVRASSPLGVSSYELDGTSGAGCQEYVEGKTPGTGAWQLIDRSRDVQNNAFSSDYAYCPQRDVAQPTIALQIATSRMRHFGAEFGYRRTSSDTVGLIGPVDRLTYPDLGLYPNDYGQAPSSGVNEERFWGRVHGDFTEGGLNFAPYADARYSVLHAALDRADAGVRIAYGAHVIDPSVGYFYPTFDGDSIFNAFSIEPTTDARLGYQYDPAGPVRALASLWLRHYAHDDGTSSIAGGADAGIERALGASWRGRVDALWDDGYGGRRAGGTGSVAWRPAESLWLRGRLIILAMRNDEATPAVAVNPFRDVVTSSEELSTTWRVADTVAIHAIAETDYDAIHQFQIRVIGILDLAFLPEP